jgi:ABC-type polar amino acid transport system ATPase subunit
MITFKQLSIYKKAQQLLKEGELTLAPGTITGILGKSGEGKSSLLRCLVGLDTEYTGTICIEGKELRSLKNAVERAQLITFAPQQPVLWPALTVYGNIVQPMLIQAPGKKKEIEAQAAQLIEALQLTALLNKLPNQLSGGQKQRVALARTLLLNAKVVLLDEPSSALDAQTATKLGNLLKEYARRGTTFIIASHDLSFIQPLADTLFVLRKQKLEAVTSSSDLACLYD